MLFRLLTSNKGFTFMEIMTVVVILAVLTAFAVPLFNAGLHAQKVKDCNSQRTVIQGTVQEAMTGMMDNGRSQPRIYFEKIQDDHEGTLPSTLSAIAQKKVTDGDIGCQNCLVLIKDQEIPGKIAFTLGDLRGGYRDTNTYPEYRDGCDWGYYLKKEKYKDVKFYVFLANEEIPVCPFADFSDTKTENDYYYYIFEDGSVYCSCADCNE